MNYSKHRIQFCWGPWLIYTSLSISTINCTPKWPKWAVNVAPVTITAHGAAFHLAGNVTPERPR